MIFWMSLLITISVETIVAAALLGLLGGARPQIANVMLCMLALNLVSHPLGWFAVSSLGVSWLLVESGVVLGETVLLKTALNTTLSVAGLVALIANGITMALGCVLL